MQYHQLLQLLNEGEPLTEEDVVKVRKHVHPFRAKKKEILLYAGDSCDRIFFVNKGMIRAYFTNHKGADVTRMIATENCFMTNMISFKRLSVNNETIECLEDAELLIIKRHDLIAMLEDSTLLRAKYCNFLEQYNAMHINHIHMVNGTKATERIQYLKRHFPETIGRASDQVIASFLGMARETFARSKPMLNYL